MIANQNVFGNVVQEKRALNLLQNPINLELEILLKYI
jgi:hypothetical protein